MRQPVVPVIHAINAAFHNFVAAAELLRFLCHIVVRFDQTQFPLTSTHEMGPEPTADWMLLSDCEVALMLQFFATTEMERSNIPIFNQLLSMQLICLDASSKIPKTIFG